MHENLEKRVHIARLKCLSICLFFFCLFVCLYVCAEWFYLFACIDMYLYYVYMPIVREAYKKHLGLMRTTKYIIWPLIFMD
jgi:hypothetical protein